MRAVDETLLRVFANVPLFANIDRVHLVWLITAVERVDVVADALFFDEGDQGDRFFVFIKGHAVVEKRSGETAWQTVAELKSGETFGEMAIVDGLPRSARVRATQDSVALALTQKSLDGYPELAAGLYRNIARIQAQRIRKFNEKMLAEEPAA
jgi:CRP-like cAMP-binding protein